MGPVRTGSAAAIRVQESIAVLERLDDAGVLDELTHVAERVIDAYRMGNKVLLFGNGGSAADAQHLAAELCGRFLIERRPLPALALVTNVSALTAIANDYGYAEVFARQVEAVGARGDVAVGISTSGDSENVVKGIEVARRLGLLTIGITGASGGRLAEAAEVCLRVPSTDTPRIQEAHIVLGHILCELVETALFGAGA